MNPTYATLRKPFLLGLLMLAAAGLTVAATPTRRLADDATRVSLEAMVPKSFGQWRVDPSIVPIQVSPDVQARLDEIYNQTLARTYVNDSGQRVMLSIAYGADQSGDATQVHRPEFCYAAQGFQILANAAGELVTRFGNLPVRRLMAVSGNRTEPITYWITVGETATLPGVGRKLAQLSYGLTGTIPDGMLVRVSSIGTNTEQAYRVQQEFISDMLQGMEPSSRIRVTGTFAS